MGDRLKKTLIGKIVKFIREFELLQKGMKIGIALSGGPDSVFLTLIFEDLQRIFKLKDCICIHINHGIRQEAEEEEAFVKEFCEKLKRPLIIRRIKDLSSNISGLEEKAREIRYKIFMELAQEYGLDRIATGHTKTDLAETMLFNLIRGTGIEGMIGIKPQRDIFIRPLLVLSKEEIEDFLRQNSIQFKVDKSNFDLRFSRNFIRHKIMPLLKKLNPDYLSHFQEFSFILYREFQFVKEKIEQLSPCFSNRYVKAYKFSGFSSFEMTYLLKQNIGRELNFEILNALIHSKSFNGPVKDKYVVKSFDEIAFFNLIPEKILLQNGILERVGDVYNSQDWGYKILLTEAGKELSMEGFSVRVENEELPIFIKFWKEDGRIKKLFQKARVPAWRRKFMPLIFNRFEKLILIPGVFKPKRKSFKNKLEVKIYAEQRSIFNYQRTDPEDDKRACQ